MTVSPATLLVHGKLVLQAGHKQLVAWSLERGAKLRNSLFGYALDDVVIGCNDRMLVRASSDSQQLLVARLKRGELVDNDDVVNDTSEIVGAAADHTADYGSKSTSSGNAIKGNTPQKSTSTKKSSTKSDNKSSNAQQQQQQSQQQPSNTTNKTTSNDKTISDTSALDASVVLLPNSNGIGLEAVEGAVTDAQLALAEQRRAKRKLDEARAAEQQKAEREAAQKRKLDEQREADAKRARVEEEQRQREQEKARQAELLRKQKTESTWKAAQEAARASDTTKKIKKTVKIETKKN